MKTILTYIYIITGLSISLLFSSCDDREMEINSSFDFGFSAKIDENVYLKDDNVIEVDLSTEHEVNGQNYNLTYSVNKKGVMKKGENEIKNLSVFSGKTYIAFNPEETGQYELTLNASNGFDKSRKVTLTFTVKKKPFDVEITPEHNDIYQSQKDMLKILVKVSNPTWVTYKFKFDAGTNSIYDENGNLLSNQKYYSIQANQYMPVLFDPNTNAGQHKIDFEFIDSQNQIVKQSIVINVMAEIANFTLKSVDKQIYFNQKAKLTYDLEPVYVNAKNQYQAIYYLTGGEGDIFIDNKKIEKGKLFNIAIAKNKMIEFKPSSLNQGSENINIKIEIFDIYNNSMSDNQTIKILKIPFTYTASRTSQEKLLMGTDKGEITNVIVPDFDNTGITYKLTFSVAGGDGKIIYNGKSYIAGQAIDLTSDNFILNYEPTNYGQSNHNITLKVTDNTGQAKTQNITFQVIKRPEIKKVIVSRTAGQENSCNMWNNCKFRYKYFYQVDAEADKSLTITEIEFEPLDNSGKSYNSFYNGNTAETQFLEENPKKPNPTHAIGTEFRFRIKDSSNQWSNWYKTNLIQVANK